VLIGLVLILMGGLCMCACVQKTKKQKNKQPKKGRADEMAAELEKRTGQLKALLETSKGLRATIAEQAAEIADLNKQLKRKR
jgi:septal ring factor EnvC (AmiA/AmiB activator)